MQLRTILSCFFCPPLQTPLWSYFSKAGYLLYWKLCPLIYLALVVSRSEKISLPSQLRTEQSFITISVVQPGPFLGMLFLAQTDWKVLLSPTWLPVWHFLTFLNNSCSSCQTPCCFLNLFNPEECKLIYWKKRKKPVLGSRAGNVRVVEMINIPAREREPVQEGGCKETSLALEPVSAFYRKKAHGILLSRTV